MYTRIVAILVLLLTLVGTTGTHAASSFADPAFQRLWRDGEAKVPNFWGPLATAHDGQREPYRESDGGHRFVQYFDKARMELRDYGTVTNGLLVTEMLTGRIQTGDTVFEPRTPPAIPIAGDANAPSVTYAALADRGQSLLDPAKSHDGFAVTVQVAPDGTPTDGGGYAGVSLSPKIGGYDATTQHNVLGFFDDYRGQVGVETVGYAITEPFRAVVRIGGTSRTVFVQLFERRTLTYNDANAGPFKVEFGNVGQHYYGWRYGGASLPPTPPATDTPGIASAQDVIAAYYAAINRREYRAAYALLVNPAQSYDQFVAGYADTKSVLLRVGAFQPTANSPTDEGRLPVFFLAVRTSGDATFTGCYTVANGQGLPPHWAITGANIVRGPDVDSLNDPRVSQLLAQTCT